MRVTIKLWDKDDGRVGFEVDPPWPKLYAIAKSGTCTPAQAYAFSGLVKMIRDSKTVGKQLSDDNPRFNKIN